MFYYNKNVALEFHYFPVNNTYGNDIILAYSDKQYMLVHMYVPCKSHAQHTAIRTYEIQELHKS